MIKKSFIVILLLAVSFGNSKVFLERVIQETTLSKKTDNNENKEIEGELNKLSIEIDQQTEEFPKKAENSSESTHKKNLTSLIESRKSLVEKINEEEIEFRKYRHEIEHENSEYSDEIEDQQNDLALAKHFENKINLIKLKVSSYEVQIHHLKNNEKPLIAQKKRIEAKFKNHNATLQSYHDEIEKYNGLISTYNTKILKLKTLNIKLKNEVSKFKALQNLYISEIQNNPNDHHAQVELNKVQKELIQKTNFQVKTQNQINNYKFLIESTNIKIHNVHTEISVLKQNFSGVFNKLASINNLLENYETQIQVIKKRSSAFSAQLKKLSKKAKNLKKKAHKALQNSELTKKNITSIIQKKKSLFDKILEQEVELRKLRHEIENIKNQSLNETEGQL